MLQTKALYNLLRLQGDVEAEKWALEDLRPLPLDELWQRLAALDIQLDRKSFLQFAEECDSPEDLAELLLAEEENDQVYLLVFELWRRLLPERISLSVFCDELDYRIDQYDKDLLESDESIQDGLANLSEILEEHVDAGMKPKEALISISEYCANDLEKFLYDYISDQEELYASELLEEFTPYLQAYLHFDFLRARLLEPAEANRRIATILNKKPDLPLLFDILQFLVTSGEHELFLTTVRQILAEIKTDEQFLELRELCADYYRRLDKDKLEQAILNVTQPTELEKVLK